MNVKCKLTLLDMELRIHHVESGDRRSGETVSAIPSTCVTLPLCIVWVMGILCMDTRVERAEFQANPQQLMVHWQVIVMAASNRKDVLDPALIRPGRFDRIIHVGTPDFEGRIEVLKVPKGPIKTLLCMGLPLAGLLGTVYLCHFESVLGSC